jgi:hypothetical protein
VVWATTAVNRGSTVVTARTWVGTDATLRAGRS